MILFFFSSVQNVPHTTFYRPSTWRVPGPPRPKSGPACTSRRHAIGTNPIRTQGTNPTRTSVAKPCDLHNNNITYRSTRSSRRRRSITTAFDTRHAGLACDVGSRISRSDSFRRRRRQSKRVCAPHARNERPRVYVIIYRAAPVRPAARRRLAPRVTNTRIRRPKDGTGGGGGRVCERLKGHLYGSRSRHCVVVRYLYVILYEHARDGVFYKHCARGRRAINIIIS